VGQDHAEPSTSLEDEAETFPQWGIAVLVIGLAAIAFVVIFGVSMVIQDLHFPFQFFPYKNRPILNITFKAVFRIHDILVWTRIRIRGSMPLNNGSDPDAYPDPTIFVIDLQDANKKLIGF
jgi:hypothetical protein